MRTLLRRAGRWSLALRVAPIVAAVLLAKVAVNLLGWEVLLPNPLLSALISALVFILGFLIVGTLADFKEAERLPGEMAVSLEALVDECSSVQLRSPRPVPAADAALAHVSRLSESIDAWLHRRTTVDTVLSDIAGLNAHFVALEPHTQATFINRAKGEQSALRRVVIRIDTIRDTFFVAPAFAVADLGIAITLVVLLTTNLRPAGHELLVVAFVTFVLTFARMLVRDLDNPFDYADDGSDDVEVSLRPLSLVKGRVDWHLATPAPAAPTRGRARRSPRA
jgi:hypothetical protein